MNLPRPDVCAVTSSPNCPNVGWSYFFDTNSLVDGAHTLGVTALAADGTVNTANSTFTVQNWSPGAPMNGVIDIPDPAEPYYTGKVTLQGWFAEPNVSIANVLITIDGIPFGNASKASRADVCAAYSSPDCPNVGWTFPLDTSLLTDDVHTLAVTGTTAAGQSFTITRVFTSEN